MHDDGPDGLWSEKTAYGAYLELKEDVLKNDGIELQLDSAYRSVAQQQDIMNRFIEKIISQKVPKSQ